jgi:pimeloyl-ACP methyl ester carboxylesterase
MRSSRAFPHFAAPACAVLLAFGAAAAPLAAVEPSEVKISAPDGILLQATHWSPGKPGPAVLLLHMCNTTRKSWFGLGPKLAERGIHALALDYRGYGESAGERSPDIAVRQRAALEVWPGDVDAAFAFLREKAGLAEPVVGVAGGSCGVNQAIMVARRHPEVRTLALLAGVSDRAGEEFLATNPWMPILGVASLDDGNAVDVLRWLVGFSSNPANEFREYAEGGHGTELFARHAELETAVADWFQRYLVREPVRPAPPPRTAQGGPSARLTAELSARGAAADLRARAAAARARGETPELPPETVINRIGYQKLGSGDTAGAIELFVLNTELHLQSANCFDSLAEAYVAAGKPDLAIEAARKTLTLLPADTGADTPFQKGIRESTLARLKELGASMP